MSTISTKTDLEQDKELLDELQNLLEQQVKLINKGDPAGKKIEKISERVNVIVEEIKQAGIIESDQFKNQREKIKKLYDCLYMAISAQKDQTEQQLNRVRKGKKTIVTYRSNI
jgi:ElaB/YqjD/DUF883 family membrane-anchored ribosome-binding protein